MSVTIQTGNSVTVQGGNRVTISAPGPQGAAGTAGAGAWGEITGTLTDQTDLATELANKITDGGNVGALYFQPGGLNLFDEAGDHIIVVRAAESSAGGTLNLSLNNGANRTLTISGNATLSGTNTGNVSLTGTPDYLTISGQTITRGLIDLATDVTGSLPQDNLNGGGMLGALVNTTASGAGTSAVNQGWHNEERTGFGTGERLTWFSDDGNYTASWNSGDAKWYLAEAGGAFANLYESASDVDYPWQATWTEIDAGVAPGPTFSVPVAFNLPVNKGGTGATTLSANAVLLGNGTSALQTVAPSTSGNVLTSNGTTWTSAAPSGGGSGTKTIGVYTPRDNQPPASAFATIDTRNSVATLDFDTATEESAIFVGVIPEAAVLTSGITVRITWAASTATSGDCRWGAAWMRCNTDIDSDSFDTATEATTTTSGTSGIPSVTSITCTSIDSLAVGEMYRLKIYRDTGDAADTMAGDAELLTVEVRTAN